MERVIDVLIVVFLVSAMLALAGIGVIAFMLAASEVSSCADGLARLVPGVGTVAGFGGSGGGSF